MELDRKVESLDEVPEVYREAYVQIDPNNSEAGFRLAVKGDDEAIVSLRQSLENERAASKEAKKRVQDYQARLERFGDITPESVNDMRTRLDGMGEDVQSQIDSAISSAKAQFEQVESKYKSKIEELESLATDKTNRLHNALKQRDALDGIQAHKGRSKFLLSEVMSHMKVLEDENGNTFTRMVDDQGNVLVSRRSGVDGPMSAEEFVEGLSAKDEWAPAFDAGVGSGGGASASGGGAGGAGALLNKPVDAMSRDDKVAFIEKYGNEKWLEKLNREQPNGMVGRYFNVAQNYSGS